MNLHTVGTGSSGNCYLLHRDNDRWITLDCGCKWKDVMIGCGFRPIDIDFALVTHSHSDHCKYARDFVASGIDVYGHENTIPMKANTVGDVTFVPFEVPHDVPCYGYLIRVDGRTIVYMTDFGYCKYTFRSWNVDTWIIACNHIEAPNIDEEKYAHVVMAHSNLHTVKDILEINKTDSMRNIILVHSSADADTDIMVNEIKETVGDINVVVATKGATIEL